MHAAPEFDPSCTEPHWFAVVMLLRRGDPRALAAHIRATDGKIDPAVRKQLGAMLDLPKQRANLQILLDGAPFVRSHALSLISRSPRHRMAKLSIATLIDIGAVTIRRHPKHKYNQLTREERLARASLAFRIGRFVWRRMDGAGHHEAAVREAVQTFGVSRTAVERAWRKWKPSKLDL